MKERRDVASGNGMDDGGRGAVCEALCRRCGACCHQKVRFGDVVVITDVPCQFLDPATRLCMVYPRRFEEQPLCAAAATSAEAGALPDHCPYVGGRSDYQAPLMLAEHPEYEEAVNDLFPERVAGRVLKSVARMLDRRKGK